MNLPVSISASLRVQIFLFSTEKYDAILGIIKDCYEKQAGPSGTNKYRTVRFYLASV